MKSKCICITANIMKLKKINKLNIHVRTFTEKILEKVKLVKCVKCKKTTSTHFQQNQ